MNLPIRVMVQAWMDSLSHDDTQRAVAELQVLNEASRQTKFRRALYSPLIDIKNKIDALQKAGFNTASLQLITWIEHKGLWKHLPIFVRQAETLLATQAILREAQVISAVPLSASEKNKLLIRLKKKFGEELTLKTRVDAQIIGGLVIDFAGVRQDASVRTKLAQVKAAITQS